MKTVLLPVHSHWCQLILNGEKTVEVRKTKPREAAPFRVLLYCTKGPLELAKDKNGNIVFLSRNKKADISDFEILSGKVIAEFVCDEISKFTAEFVDEDYYEDIRYCYTTTDDEEDEIIISTNEDNNPNKNWLCKESCLSFDDVKKYIGVNFHEIPFYAWHISALKIEKLTDISKFTNKNHYYLKKPPQSWCYVTM